MLPGRATTRHARNSKGDRVHASAAYVGYSVGCTPGTHDGWRREPSVALPFARGRRHAPNGSRSDGAH
jgi:hypothetical protein